MIAPAGALSRVLAPACALRPQEPAPATCALTVACATYRPCIVLAHSSGCSACGDSTHGCRRRTCRRARCRRRTSPWFAFSHAAEALCLVLLLVACCCLPELSTSDSPHASASYLAPPKRLIHRLHLRSSGEAGISTCSSRRHTRTSVQAGRHPSAAPDSCRRRSRRRRRCW